MGFLVRLPRPVPVWQQFHQQHAAQGIEVLSVAMDAQGADRPRPYAEQAGATFTTVVDESNLLGELYGFRAVPNGFLIDEEGIVRHKKLGGFDIRRAETAPVLEQWVAGFDLSDSEAPGEVDLGAGHSDSNAMFREGLEHYRQGRVEDAMTLWRQGLALDPGNYIIRKQIWAVEDPDRFYSGDVDYRWQREQAKAGS